MITQLEQCSFLLTGRTMVPISCVRRTSDLLSFVYLNLHSPLWVSSLSVHASSLGSHQSVHIADRKKLVFATNLATT